MKAYPDKLKDTIEELSIPNDEKKLLLHCSAELRKNELQGGKGIER